MNRVNPELRRIGRNICQFRTLRNYTQKYVAKQLNISRSTLSTWENGTTPVSIERLIKLAEVFGVDNYRQLIDFDPNTIFNPINFKNEPRA
jgi:transcriptional regulator with XRE-family HTH domain